MSQAWTEELWQDTLKQLYHRAATDGKFRRRCLEDAHAAIEEISGLAVPEGAQVRFVEQIDEQVLVLPKLLEEGAELTEEELAEAAGGVSTGRRTCAETTCSDTCLCLHQMS